MKKIFETNFSSNVTRSILISVHSIVIMASLALPIFNVVAEPLNRTLLFAFAGIATISLLFSWRGNLLVGRVVVSILSFALIFILAYVNGLRDPAMYGFSAVILLGGLLLGQGGGTIFGILSALAALIIGTSEINGILKTKLAQYTEFTDVIVVMVFILLATLIQRFLIQRLNETIRSSKENEKTQFTANQELRILQTELEKRVDQRTAQLRASNEIGKIASSILDPDVVVTKAVNLITETFDYYYAAIFLVVENGRWVELKDATGSAGEILKSRRHRLQVGGNSMVGTVITSQKALVALDVGESAIRFNNPLLPNTRSEIALPLIVGERAIGVLDVQSTREADFNPDDISVLQGMTNQVAIAIENARLFKEMDATLEELRQSNRQYVVSAWSDKLKGNVMEYTTRTPLAVGNEPGKEVQINLNLRDQNIGYIRLETDAEWTPEDQSWVEALATQVAISLENSRLLEESQQSALRERLSASIVQKIWSSNSIDSILQTAVRELGRALEASEATIELKIEE
jgi:GAF domain-containing protein